MSFKSTFAIVGTEYLILIVEEKRMSNIEQGMMNDE